MEILVASYASLMCHVQLENTLSRVLQFVQGLCTVGSQLIHQRHAGIEDVGLVDKLLNSGLDTLRLAYFVSRDPFEKIDDVDFITIHKTIQAISSWHCEQLPPSPFSTFLDHFQELVKLDLYLKFRLDYYLLAMRRSDNGSEKLEATVALRMALSQIIEQVHRLLHPPNLVAEAMNSSHSWPWSTGGVWMDTDEIYPFPFIPCKIAFTYALAVVLWDATGETRTMIYANDNTQISAGELMCRFFAIHLSQSQPRWIFRSAAQYLFWAGIGLGKEEHDGNPKILVKD